MKKVIAIFTLLILVALTFNIGVVNATDSSAATVNVTFDSQVLTNQVIIIITLGSFSGVEENSVMTATATLEYDDTYVESVEVSTSNDWTATVSEDSKTILFETDAAFEDIEIGRITINLNTSAVEEATEATVSLTEFNISDGATLDETYTGPTVTYTVSPSDDTDDSDDEIVVNTATDDEEENVVDNTLVTESKLPQTGISVAIAIAIIAVVLLAIMAIIRYKSIKLK